LTLLAACLGERERPGPPRLSFTIDDTTVVSSRTDTIAGSVRAEDADGIDSVWVTAASQEQREDGGFSQVMSTRYRLVIPAGTQPGAQIPLSFRARDAAGFEAQRDTYVVALP
jgi:hypothetical protein